MQELVLAVPVKAHALQVFLVLGDVTDYADVEHVAQGERSRGHVATLAMPCHEGVGRRVVTFRRRAESAPPVVPTVQSGPWIVTGLAV